MAILIRDPDTDRLIRELAGRTGESITDAVRLSVEERLNRIPLVDTDLLRRKRRLREITSQFDALADRTDGQAPADDGAAEYPV